MIIFNFISNSRELVCEILEILATSILFSNAWCTLSRWWRSCSHLIIVILNLVLSFRDWNGHVHMPISGPPNSEFWTKNEIFFFLIQNFEHGRPKICPWMHPFPFLPSFMLRISFFFFFWIVRICITMVSNCIHSWLFCRRW